MPTPKEDDTYLRLCLFKNNNNVILNIYMNFLNKTNKNQ